MQDRKNVCWAISSASAEVPNILSPNGKIGDQWVLSVSEKLRSLGCMLFRSPEHPVLQIVFCFPRKHPECTGPASDRILRSVAGRPL